MLVVPISFVTEHIETLHEINIEGRRGCEESRHIERFRMMPAVGDSPIFHRSSEGSGLQAVEAESPPKGFHAAGWRRRRI